MSLEFLTADDNTVLIRGFHQIFNKPDLFIPDSYEFKRNPQVPKPLPERLNHGR